MPEPTVFTTIEDNYDPGEEWPDGRHDIVTAVLGDLANRVQAATQRTGGVTIHERGVEGGYSEYTVEWDWEFEVRCGGDVVWQTSDYSQADFGPNRYVHNSLSRFLEWLDALTIRDAIHHPDPRPEQRTSGRVAEHEESS